MQNFKVFLEQELAQTLTEGRDAPLYHGTIIQNLIGIIRDDVLKIKGQGDPWFPLQQEISMTRSLEHAMWFAKHRFGNGGGGGYRVTEFCVIEFDQSMLAQTFKIEPTQRHRRDLGRDQTPMSRPGKKNGWNEFEEVVHTKQIPHVYKYIKRIFVTKSAANEWKESWDKAPEIGNKIRHKLHVIDNWKQNHPILHKQNISEQFTPKQIGYLVRQQIRKSGHDDAWEVNNGWCMAFANRLAERLGKDAKVVDSTHHYKQGTFPGHSWVEYHGMHYDAETPDGVSDPKQMQYHKRLRAIADSPKGSDERDVVRKALGHDPIYWRK